MNKNIFFVSVKVFAIFGLVMILRSRMDLGQNMWVTHWDRTPSSILDSFDISIFQDLFMGRMDKTAKEQTYGKKIRYEVLTDLQSNRDEKEYVKMGKNVLQLAMGNTFGILGKGAALSENTQNEASAKESKDQKVEQSFLQIFKGQLVAQFIENYVKSLYVFKLVKLGNSHFQIDLSLVPKKDSPENFDQEMGTNQLIKLSNVGKLEDYLTDANETVAGSVAETAKLIPASKEKFQYLGGTVSVWFNILDMTWKPLKKFFPDTKSQALKGFIRFRRYFRVNDPAVFDVAGTYRDVKVSTIDLNKNADNYITVDVYQSFDLENMVPELESMNVSFGQLLNNKLESKDRHTQNQKVALSSYSQPDSDNDVISGDFLVSGNYQASKRRNPPINFKLKSANYSFKTKTFLKIAGDYKSGSLFQQKQKEQLFNLLSLKLKNVGFERFHSKF
jgi:hypothetical protein